MLEWPFYDSLFPLSVGGGASSFMSKDSHNAVVDMQSLVKSCESVPVMGLPTY